MRLFVGLSLPEAVRQQLLLLAGGLKGARWQRDDQLHITLRFLGEVDGATAGDIDEALGGIAMSPFGLRIRGMGLFGTLKAPRILWAGVDPEADVRRLHDKVAQRMTDLGVIGDGRKYAPHVTLARFGRADNNRKRNTVSGLGEFVTAHDDFETPAFKVEAFHLYSSVLGGEGPTYRIEATYPLQP